MGQLHFGVLTLSLVAAGDLIVKCLWFRGEIKAKVPTKESYSLQDPDLTAALADKAELWAKRLAHAVETGTLQTVEVGRDIDDRIIPAKTWVNASDLTAWLEARSVELGEIFYTDYLDVEVEIAQLVARFVQAERYRRSVSKAEGETNAEILFLQHQVLQMEEQLGELQSRLKSPSSVSDRQQSAYLRIIGALLGLLLGRSPSGQPFSKFESQQAVIDAIHGHFGERAGLSKRNLEDKFAQGKRLLEE